MFALLSDILAGLGFLCLILYNITLATGIGIFALLGGQTTTRALPKAERTSDRALHAQNVPSARTATTKPRQDDGVRSRSRTAATPASGTRKERPNLTYAAPKPATPPPQAATNAPAAHPAVANKMPSTPVVASPLLTSTQPPFLSPPASPLLPPLPPLDCYQHEMWATPLDTLFDELTSNPLGSPAALALAVDAHHLKCTSSFPPLIGIDLASINQNQLRTTLDEASVHARDVHGQASIPQIGAATAIYVQYAFDLIANGADATRLYDGYWPSDSIVKANLERLAHWDAVLSGDEVEQVATVLAAYCALRTGADLANRLGDPGAGAYYEGRAHALADLVKECSVSTHQFASVENERISQLLQLAVRAIHAFAASMRSVGKHDRDVHSFDMACRLLACATRAWKKVKKGNNNADAFWKDPHTLASVSELGYIVLCTWAATKSWELSGAEAELMHTLLSDVTPVASKLRVSMEDLTVSTASRELARFADTLVSMLPSSQSPDTQHPIAWSHMTSLTLDARTKTTAALGVEV
ncbi:hypothetical protein THASP1DRAFT_27205 [Thamnocephalis sphaerospora]|uniref:Uncharacterized protein n=1 Tax=Thamnocephalis sphaerospora TaxID=78915 RepID=A0A4P9XY59_9FUNG|nr:hypothetical protein THASP1DRAFT_27205 [Thamnocephalis sphaerospora]|eukprot:RKP11032.1 hypothetical protein THASP1DRAFT_27205 [Thamnocephalis sphaerospora]